MFLHREAMPVAHRTRARVCPVRSQKSSLASVGQIGVQDLGADALAELGIFHRENHLDAFVEIALHPVGAAQIQLRRAAIFEIINAAVLQETPDDAAHADAAAQPAHCPRTIRSISTPACEARYSAWITGGSTTAFILMIMRAGRPRLAWRVSRS